MGGSTSNPVVADSSASAAIITQTQATGCPVQHSSASPKKTLQPSISECPAIATGGCDSSTIDRLDVLDPTNMVKQGVNII